MIRALLGGSFDPVHEGHVAMARHVLQANLAQIVHVTPAWLSPHKNQSVASAAHRLAMVQLAFADLPDLVVDTREMDRSASCYTIDTMADMQREFPDDQWLLVVGGDNLTSFRQWHDPQRLQALARIAVLGRQGHESSAEAVKTAGLDTARVHIAADFDQPVSSTAVRAMLRAGPTTVDQLVAGGISPAVAAYIFEYRLYFPDQNGETRVPDPD